MHTSTNVERKPGPVPVLRSKSRFVLPLLLAATVCLLYLPLAHYPFVQDDWALLHEFTFRPVAALVLDILSPAGKLFYRPTGVLCSAIVYMFFGLNALGCHLISILLLGVASFLLVYIAWHCTGDRRVAWGSGFIYAAAANIHLDPQMWLVGIYDTGAGVCALACIAAFLRNRHRASAFWFAMALGCKESALTLVFVLLAYGVLMEDHGASIVPALRTLFRRLRLHVIILAVYAACKAVGVSLFGFSLAHPYAARLFGGNIADHVQLFAQWVLQALTPTKNIVFSGRSSLVFLTLASAVLVAVYIPVAMQLQKKGTDVRGPFRLILFLGAWGLLLLLPPVALQNQILRYYLVIVLPPCAIGAMVVVKAAFHPFGRGARYLAMASAVLAAANVIDGTLFIQRRISLGAREGIHSSGREGDNHLIRKASVVLAVWKPLLALIPSVPVRSVIIMEGVDTGTFADRFGPQVWYRDSTLRVTGIVPNPPDSNGVYRVALPPDDPWKYPVGPNIVTVPAARVFHVRYDEGAMELVHPVSP
jgi:hypothetical protein